MKMEFNLPPDIEKIAVQAGLRVMFHGTCKQVEAFSEALIGRGSDDNSALGVHLTDYAHHAAEYAQIGSDHGEGDGSVLVVLAPAHNPFVESDYDRFFGLNEEGSPDPGFGRAGFARMRAELITQGHDIVDYEDGNGPISVALDPSKLLIVGRMNMDEAVELGEKMDALEDFFSTPARLAFLRENISLPAPRRPRP